MIPAIACLLLPFAGDCSAFVRDVPRIADVERSRAAYTGKLLSVRGRVGRLEQWTSRRGRPEELFSVCDGGCIRVFMRARSPIHEGEAVTVRGTYYETFCAGGRTYSNELEAAEVLPRE